MALNIPTENWFVCWPCREYFKKFKTYERHKATLHPKTSKSLLGSRKQSIYSYASDHHEETTEDVNLDILNGDTTCSIEIEENSFHRTNLMKGSDALLDEKTGYFTGTLQNGTASRPNTKSRVVEHESVDTTSSSDPSLTFEEHVHPDNEVLSSTSLETRLNKSPASPCSSNRKMTLRPRDSRQNFIECYDSFSEDDIYEDVNSLDSVENMPSKFKPKQEDAVKPKPKELNISDMLKDEEENSVKNYFKCGVCSKRFHLRIILKRHLLKHSINDAPGSVRCKDCGKGLISSSRNHRCYHQRIHSYKCPQCIRVCSRWDSFKRHLLMHKEKQFSCSHCQRAHWRKDALQQHLRVHHRFDNAGTRIIDLTTTENSPCLTIRNNGKSIVKAKEEDTNQVKSKQHVRMKKGARKKLSGLLKARFICSMCDTLFSTQTSLTRHFRRNHTGKMKQFVCNECGANFKRNDTLQRHKLSHSEERPHLCKVCGRAFKRHDLLIRHLRRTHSM